MLQTATFKSQLLLAGESLGGGSATNFATFIQVGLFMLFLAIFVFACGMAWRTLPFLRKLLPATFLNQTTPKQTFSAILADRGPGVAEKATTLLSRPGQLTTSNSPLSSVKEVELDREKSSPPALPATAPSQATRREWIIFLSLSALLLINTAALVLSFVFLK